MSYDVQEPCQDNQNREDKGGYLFASCVAVGTDKKPCQEARAPAKETQLNVSGFAEIGTPFAVA
jgi:hypothetical protein